MAKRISTKGVKALDRVAYPVNPRRSSQKEKIRPENVVLDKVHRPLSGSNFDYGVRNLENMVELYKLNIDPDYQRDHVWTVAQKAAFVGHLLSGGETAPLIINELPDHSTEMVDGKQRLTACREWIRNEFPAVTWNGTTLWFQDMDEISLTMLAMSITVRFLIVKMSRAEILELYIRLNKGGTVHSDEEIAKVQRLLDIERNTQ